MTAKEDSGQRRAGRTLRVPVLMRLSQCAIRFLLAAVLSGAQVFGGHSLFGLAMVGVSGTAPEGFAALLGAAFGYLSFLGFLEALRYIAAAMMIFAVGMAMYEFRISRTAWFMPAVSAALNALVGFVYLSAGGWSRERAVYFAAEVLLTAGTVYFYRLAFSVWEERRPGRRVSVQQTVGLLVLGGTLLMTLARVTVAGVSVGRVLAALAVLAAGWRGGLGTGAVAGVAAGLAMDLAGAAAPVCTAVYGFSGLTAGIFARQGRVFARLAGVLAAGAAVLCRGGGRAELAVLYEVAAAGVLLLIVPDKLLRRFSALTRQEGAREEDGRTRRYTARRLEQAAQAFRAVSAGLEGAAAPPENDADAAKIFDRAAGKVCRSCTNGSLCWQRDYQATRGALADTLPGILDRGGARAGDFPPYFADRCLHFKSFLAETNRQLDRLLERRMYDSRIRESRAAVCAQYDQLAGVLEQAASEVAAELPVDAKRQLHLKQRMTALGLEGRCAVFSDERRHLRAELEGEGVEQLGEAEELTRLEQLLGCRLKAERRGPGVLCLAQAEPLTVVAGVACAGKDGGVVSGDTGAWFRDGTGQAYVLLCDGMGSGTAARRESDGALSLLEKFLRAGMEAQQALDTVGQALALQGEATGGFTTVDLLRVDLFTGEGCLYKLGAAPSYLRRGGRVERLCGTSLPAGLCAGGEMDAFPLELAAGDVVVMVSDGVSNGREDGWILRELEEFDGLSPQTLAKSLMAGTQQRQGGADDRTVIALRLDVRK